ncbi:MAG: sodium-dependent transporter [Gammaproteobacteria bacterium]|nr:MAG: sodium-dependent transporter [Gammaproteobacteria bacterium]
MAEKVETWSSHLAFYLCVAGAAVGLGSLWRFPFLAGQYGGGLFVLVFVLACVLIAVPLLTAEFMLGRRGGPNVPAAAGRVATAAGRSPRWAAIGTLGTLAMLLIMSYYTVIGGWVFAYVGAYASGAAAGLDSAELAARFAALLADPWRLAFWHALFMLATVAISIAGLHRGIERANEVMLPGLFGILIGLAAYALSQGDAHAAIAFLTHVDLSQLSGELVLAAVGQAFFATGVGMAIMMAYGSHVTADESLPRSAVIVVSSIVLASVLASLLIFPLVFGSGVDPAHGPQLAFIVLPSIFVDMPGSTLIGTLFFVLLAFAALSSAIAGFEPAGAWLMERYDLRRGRAIALIAAATWLAGIGTVLSFNLWREVHPLAAFERFRTATIFDLTDFIAANLLLPAGALLTCILVGWRLARRHIGTDFGRDARVATVLLALLRYLCPLAIVGVLAGAL